MGTGESTVVLAARNERRVAVPPSTYSISSTHVDCWMPSSVASLSVGLYMQSNKNSCVEDEISEQPERSGAHRSAKRDHVSPTNRLLLVAPQIVVGPP